LGVINLLAQVFLHHLLVVLKLILAPIDFDRVLGQLSHIGRFSRGSSNLSAQLQGLLRLLALIKSLLLWTPGQKLRTISLLLPGAACCRTN
jgi:hypothetical protein